jgi:inhibitor of KinA
MGDRGLVIRFEEPPSNELTSHLAGLAKALRGLEGVIDAAPGHQTVLVEGPFSRLKEIPDDFSDLVSDISPYEGPVAQVPITYDGEDLEWLCNHTSLTPSQFIAVHSAPTYQVRLIGSPGFIYLSQVDERIKAPRLEIPRKNVPQGAVGIGGSQTGIYGRARPGGWRLIGSVTQIPEAQPGDQIQFIPK